MSEMLCRGTIVSGLQAGRPCGYRARLGSAFCKHHEPVERRGDPLIEMLDTLRLHGRLDVEETNALERAHLAARIVA